MQQQIDSVVVPEKKQWDQNDVYLNLIYQILDYDELKRTPKFGSDSDFVLAAEDPSVEMDPAQIEAKEPGVSQQKPRSTSTRRISGKQLKESKVEDKTVTEEKNVNDEFKPKIKHLWEDHRLISSYDSQFFRLMKEYYGNIVSE